MKPPGDRPSPAIRMTSGRGVVNASREFWEHRVARQVPTRRWRDPSGQKRGIPRKLPRIPTAPGAFSSRVMGWGWDHRTLAPNGSRWGGSPGDENGTPARRTCTSAAKPIECASLRCPNSFYNPVTVVDPPPRPRRSSTAGILKIQDGRLVADFWLTSLPSSFPYFYLS
jgi:hypothetical protein